MCQSKQGFVLLELMTVVSIIGILAIMSLPSYIQHLKRAKTTEALSLARPITHLITEYYAYYGQLPTSNQDLMLPEPQKIRGNHVKSIEIKYGSIHVTFFDPLLRGVLTIRPTILPTGTPAHSLTWICGRAGALAGMRYMSEDKTTIKSIYLPLSCQ